MEQRIQMRGHCQGCGRLQAATKGVLAHHGYTVEFGYFSGTCYGAKELPLEVNRELLDKNLAGARREADRLEDRALQIEQGEYAPKDICTQEARKETRWQKACDEVRVPWAEATEEERRYWRKRTIHALRQNGKGLRQWADDMAKLADQVHGKPLVEVKLHDEAKVIKVGDQVKVWGRVVTVEKIAGATARGCGPYLNGNYMDHVFWMDGDKEFKAPKRSVRKVQPAA